MALYVQYTPDVYPQQEGQVLFWLFPEEFSQSQLGDRELGSNACTLIALLTAARIQVLNIPIWGLPDQPLSRMLVTTLAEAIIEGNDIYENLAISGQLTDPNLDITEALAPIREKYPLLAEWPILAMNGRENIIREPIGQSLSNNIREFLMYWIYNPPIDKIPDSDLFIVLVANTRTCLFVYQPQVGKIALVDSHAHHAIRAGAVVAQSRAGDLDHLCDWFSAMCLHCYGAGPDISEYELSCIYMQDIGLYDLNEET
ncbi:unnamed protein product [Allacma fusca]|uniref:Uncharacterized protein n=1 Tax=Allacma fusca TaxID=39272 RepID=A0A8J2LWQ8_9HEXA|nr:unnamed protein product [Allacma fusca]